MVLVPGERVERWVTNFRGRHGETGLVTPPEDPGALADALSHFFARGMGAAMRTNVERLRRAHSWDALADGAVDLVDELRPARGWR